MHCAHLAKMQSKALEYHCMHARKRLPIRQDLKEIVGKEG